MLEDIQQRWSRPNRRRSAPSTPKISTLTCRQLGLSGQAMVGRTEPAKSEYTHWADVRQGVDPEDSPRMDETETIPMPDEVG